MSERDSLLRFCGLPWLPRAVVSAALILLLPCLWVGRLPDDQIQRLLLRAEPGIAGLETAPLDLFVFSSGDPAQVRAFQQEGVFAWWSARDFRLAFWRPLASATHWLDQKLVPDGLPLQHLHSLGWYALLLVAVAALYRRLLPPELAGLALLLYAVDDAHAVPVAFLAHRNALMAGALGVAALACHDRSRRSGDRGAARLVPILLGLGLLCGEAALGILGYLGAHALLLDTGPWRRRLRSLAPTALVVLVWLMAHHWMGYGARSSGVYLDPLDRPGAYLAALPVRLPVLLLGLFGAPPADFWIFLGPRLQSAQLVWGILFLSALALFLLPLLRQDRMARFWALGLVLSCLPVCATFPHDRLLLLPGLGAMGLLASVLGEPDPAASRSPPGRALRRSVWVVLAILHLLLAPLMLPLRAASVQGLVSLYDRLDRSVPREPGVEEQTLVVVHAPGDGLVAYLPFIRQADGTRRPRRMRLLATSQGAIEVHRPDEHTLILRVEDGLLGSEAERMLRSPDLPFRPGDRIDLGDLAVEVRSVTSDGRPREVAFRFDRGLDHPDLLWMRWGRSALEPWSPPPAGGSDRWEPPSALGALLGGGGGWGDRLESEHVDLPGAGLSESGVPGPDPSGLAELQESTGSGSIASGRDSPRAGGSGPRPGSSPS